MGDGLWKWERKQVGSASRGWPSCLAEHPGGLGSFLKNGWGTKMDGSQAERHRNPTFSTVRVRS